MEQESIDKALARLQRWDRSGDGESIPDLKREMQQVMEEYCGVFRTEEVLKQGVVKIHALQERLGNAVLKDHSKIFNTARIEALELENLMDISLATVHSALERKESRGAHSRIDYPDRDDAHWMKHSLYFKEGDQMEYKPVRTKPMTVDSFPPKPRVY